MVYGCDDWFWGIFHTEQSWLLSRAQVISRAVQEKAEQVFAYQAPWYDQQARWMKIKQGESEGCKYNTATEAEDLDAQFERMLEETEEMENQENTFTFDNEDFFDDEMTEEEIQQWEADQEQQLADARPAVETLEKGAFTFYQALLGAPNFLRFPDESDKTWYMAYYLEDKMIGGGSIFQETFYYGASHWVEGPALAEWRKVLT